RGARVRCRRCGEAIVVLKPEDRPPASVRDASGGLLDLRTVVRESLEEAAPPLSQGVREEPASPSPSPPPPPVVAEAAPQDSSLPAGSEGEMAGIETAFEKYLASGGRGPEPESAEVKPSSLTDLAVDFRPEDNIDLGIPAEPPKVASSPEFLIGDTETLDLLKEAYKKGGVFDISPSLRQEPQDLIPQETIPVPPQPAAPQAPVPQETRTVPEADRPKSPGPRRAASPLLRPSLVVLLLMFVALAGGGAYLGFTRSGQDLLGGLIPRMESFWLRGAGKPGPQYDVRNLIGFYETNSAAGNLFVIKGQVANMGRNRKSGIRIHATLLDGRDQAVVEKTIYAGNVLPGETLRTASRVKIEEALSNRFGDRLANMDIAPGKSVPFMVVFFDAPEGISAYRIEAKDGD
ncbi:MAG TPA: DUF3426 domain-containing protein, partial [Candidatus Limnocylindrales bacterium]|nr:DUF3426 domain-containing protein [Candidatus Limnocylindrales bacterium]